jgi:hypothetical protein
LHREIEASSEFVTISIEFLEIWFSPRGIPVRIPPESRPSGPREVVTVADPVNAIDVHAFGQFVV